MRNIKGASYKLALAGIVINENMKQLLIIGLIYLFVTSCVSKKTGTNNTIIKDKQIEKEISNNPKYIPLSHFNGDTLKYLTTNFTSHKEFYQGKGLNVLLQDLELPVKEFKTGVNARDINISPGLSLKFYNRDIEEKKIKERKNPLVLYVIWQIPLPEDDVTSIIRTTHGYWNNQANNYFRQFKIKEIGMVAPNY
ncbi:hypothetical protein [Pedobacter arcticus]|uniref:hypothetical protein n=1 Tax=Pedobacter arcticus TaxID=752140 RepID=UPI0003666826|nr:hypothetical protein [Pedobacter arcticus]